MDPGTPGTLRVWCRVCVSVDQPPHFGLFFNRGREFISRPKSPTPHCSAWISYNVVLREPRNRGLRSATVVWAQEDAVKNKRLGIFFELEVVCARVAPMTVLAHSLRENGNKFSAAQRCDFYYRFCARLCFSQPTASPGVAVGHRSEQKAERAS